MAAKTGIEWTDSTWSPIRFRVRQNAAEIARAKGYTSLVQIAEKMAGRVGQHCEHASPGCTNCYAETNNHRCLPANGTGLPYDRRSRDLVEPFIDEKALLLPLKWKPVIVGCRGFERGILHDPILTCAHCVKRPRRIFVENQSDLFGEWITDEMRDRVFAIQGLSHARGLGHIYQVLTKRPAEALAYYRRRTAEWASRRFIDIPGLGSLVCELIVRGMESAWVGVSPVNQPTTDEYIPLLRQIPAAIRYLSCEPLLGSITFRPVCESLADKLHAMEHSYASRPMELTGIDWVIVGGESGPGARPMDLRWISSIVAQCKSAGVPCFVKQLGTVPMEPEEDWRGRAVTRTLKSSNRGRVPSGFVPINAGPDRKGGDPAWWPDHLRVQQFPEVPNGR